MSAEQVTITRLGAEGDGIAEGPVYVPFALPGETVNIARVKNEGTIMSFVTTAPERQPPACRHFGPDGLNGTCGGCTLQHLADEAYRAFKVKLVADALASKGFDIPLQPLVTAAPGERRRAVFTARRTEKELLLGFSQAGSHHIVNITECPVVVPGIESRLDTLRVIGRALAVSAEPFRMTVTETLAGLDIAVEGIKAVSDRQRRMAIEIILGERGIARVSLNGDILIEPQKPELDFGGARVVPPPGGFSQASRKAEEAMAALVMAGLGKVKRVADLFAGSGTFSLRIARVAQVLAVESEGPALAALDKAARATQGLKPVAIEKRDLFRRPMMAQELKYIDAVVFDPPRAGAEAQARELARSAVKTIIAVSCNPLTLARDLRILVDAGYSLKSVTPIDQFLWTSHVEVVAVLGK